MLALLAQFFAFLALVWALKRFTSKRDIDNIPGPEPESFFKGNLAQMFNASSIGWEFNSMLSERYGRVVRIWGMFGSKYLEIHDPKALHHILVKDQVVYEETSSFFASNTIMFGQGLLSTQGEQHKKQRKMLNPVFSIAHMRNMDRDSHQEELGSGYQRGRQIPNESRLRIVIISQVDILHWMSRAALEMIGQSGLGYSFDPLVEAIDKERCSSASPTTHKMSLEIQVLLPILVKIGSPKFRRWCVDHFPSKRLRAIRDIIDIWDRTTTEIFEEKKKALKEGDEALAKQIGQAKDIMSILMKANMNASEEDKLPDKEVLGQSEKIIRTFAFAATDTTSNALSRTLHLLALHPEAQERLRAEVTEARKSHDGDIPYDDLVSLPFMDAVCRETLRLQVVQKLLTSQSLILHLLAMLRCQRARKDILLPLSTPIKGIDGREMDSILVPKNTEIFIAILNANRDPLLWGPDSLEWKPERWLAPIPEATTLICLGSTHICYLTFLGGGRACIGFKFSQLEMKVVLSTLISQFRFYPPEKEIVWQNSGITNPTLKDFPEIPQLPLMMELVNAKA
ncbi:Cytochrome P450 3A9 [Termitomyces sp. J132]|nr:Cytochrome P450 3A9 [Termitomyces sp. J132]